MTEPEVTNDKDLRDDSKTTKKSKEENAKSKRNAKKKVSETENNEEEEEADAVTDSRSKRAQKSDKNTARDMNTDAKEKIPLLDQPVIMEGSRNRRTVVQFESKVPVAKFSPIEIPNGNGTPLGRIPNVNKRMKRLRQNVLKELHRFLFGKFGNPANFIVNLQKFCGFPFEKESDHYNRKLHLLNKFSITDIKELLYFLDLDLKWKKKDEAVKRVLDFLLSPNISATEQTTQPIGHPKRKATKRNYEDAEIDEIEFKKRKKVAVTKFLSQETESDKIEENGKGESRRKTKNSTDNETDVTDEDIQKDQEPDPDANSEMKKPAKKRKRNQIIEEPKEVASEFKKQKKKSSDKQKKKQEDESEKIEVEALAEEENEKRKTDLTDEELKNFLQKVLANANLEETTMKTVYGLINTHYPQYNFSKKKDFIKEIVKSLLQSS